MENANDMEINSDGPAVFGCGFILQVLGEYSDVFVVVVDFQQRLFAIFNLFSCDSSLCNALYG